MQHGEHCSKLLTASVVITELHFQYNNYIICYIFPHLISSNRMSARPTCAAWYIGVLRWWMLPFGSAPAFRRIFTQSRCPLTTAMYRAVWPFTSTRSTAAPWEIRYTTHSLWPIMAAIRSGVQGSQPQEQINFSLICLQNNSMLHTDKTILYSVLRISPLNCTWE